MRQVDGNSQLVHRFHNCHTEIGKPGIGSLRAAVPEEVSRVVGELDDAGAGVVKKGHVVDIPFDTRRVLETQQDPELVLSVRAVDIVRAEHFDQSIRLAVESSLPLSESFERDAQVAVVEAGVERGDAGAPNQIPIGIG